MTALRLGPLLRWVGERAATVWVETDAPCEVAVLGRSARTFTVGGHHYALVIVDGLEPATEHEYEVHLDGERVWPLADAGMPPSAIRTLDPRRRLHVTFGSCRVAGERDLPGGVLRLMRRYDPALDAMAAYAETLMLAAHEERPDLLLLLGDQVYADNAPEETRRFMRERRDVDRAPYEAVADLEEYTRLYADSWSERRIRWLLSSVPSAMIFDDHELIDDWEISRAWVDEVEDAPEWDERLAGALMAYWLYQHLGNLDPDALRDDPLLAAVRQADDGVDVLRHQLMDLDAAAAGSRWSYVRDVGDVRLIALDARATRVLDEDRRDMMDEREWEKLARALDGDARHVILASSVPIVYAEGIHHVQAWSERVGQGAWGPLAARVVEHLRRALSLSGWPAFGRSFARLMDLLAEAGARADGRAPESITLVSGDVHHGYVARLRWPDRAGVRTSVHQVVSSPFRNPLMPHERGAQRMAASRLGAVVLRTLAWLARTPPPEVVWRRLEGPEFANQLATMEITPAGVRLRSSRAVHRAGGSIGLATMWERALHLPEATLEPAPALREASGSPSKSDPVVAPDPAGPPRG